MRFGKESMKIFVLILSLLVSVPANAATCGECCAVFEVKEISGGVVIEKSPQEGREHSISMVNFESNGFGKGFGACYDESGWDALATQDPMNAVYYDAYYDTLLKKWVRKK